MSSQVSTARDLFPIAWANGSGLSWLNRLRRDFLDLYRYWPVIQNLVSQDLRVRYQRSLLGFFWTLLNPILMMATLSVVFSNLIRAHGAENYALYLFSGMVPWALLASTVNDASICVIANEVLIRKIYVPKLVFPVSRLLLNLTMLVLSMTALFVMMIPLGASFHLSLLLLPVVLILYATFVLGLSLIVCIVNTFYRDFGHLITVLLQAWYFATPIIYPLSYLPESIQWKFRLNPAYPFIRLFQVIIHDGDWPSGVLLGITTGIAATVLALGYATFKAYEDKLVFRL